MIDNLREEAKNLAMELLDDLIMGDGIYRFLWSHPNYKNADETEVDELADQIGKELQDANNHLFMRFGYPR